MSAVVLKFWIVEVHSASDSELAAVILNRGTRERVSTDSPHSSQEMAEQELLKRLVPRVRLYGLKHLRDEQAAADLTQHVLLIVLESLRGGKVKDPDKLGSFVFGTCRMVVMDQRRGEQRRAHLLDKFAAEFPAVMPPSADPPDLVALTRCLQALTERERSVVTLTFFDEQGSATVASSLGLTESNVRVIRHRALSKLRNCMTGEAA